MRNVTGPPVVAENSYDKPSMVKRWIQRPRPSLEIGVKAALQLLKFAPVLPPIFGKAYYSRLLHQPVDLSTNSWFKAVHPGRSIFRQLGGGGLNHDDVYSDGNPRQRLPMIMARQDDAKCERWNVRSPLFAVVGEVLVVVEPISHLM